MSKAINHPVCPVINFDIDTDFHSEQNPCSNRTIDQEIEQLFEAIEQTMWIKKEVVDEEIAYSKSLNRAATIRIIRLTCKGTLVCYTTKITFHTLGTTHYVTKEYQTKMPPRTIIEYVRRAKRSGGGSYAYICAEEIDKRLQKMVEN